MKTAISIPDDVFKSADYLAKKQGISRSEFYVTAIKAYMSKRRANVTELLNSVYEQTEGFDDVVQDAALVDLPKEEW
jgi:metal-responsive CopG/Arc/MetJ family transcriptional regulator